MKTRRSFLKGLVGALTLVTTTSYAWPVDAGEPPVHLVLVVAKDSPVSNISFYDLKRLYLGERLNVADKRLIALNLVPQTPERERFDKAVLNMSPEVVARYWIDRKIRGDSGPPKTIDSADLLQRVVTRLDGSIGYAPTTAIRPDVKAIHIDGKGPSDSGYPL